MPKDTYQWTPSRNLLLYNLSVTSGRFDDDFKTLCESSVLFQSGDGSYDTSVRARLKFVARKIREKGEGDRAKKGRLFWTEEDFCVGNNVGKKGRKGGEGGVGGSIGSEVSGLERFSVFDTTSNQFHQCFFT